MEEHSKTSLNVSDEPVMGPHKRRMHATNRRRIEDDARMKAWDLAKKLEQEENLCRWRTESYLKREMENEPDGIEEADVVMKVFERSGYRKLGAREFLRGLDWVVAIGPRGSIIDKPPTVEEVIRAVVKDAVLGCLDAPVRF